jgi:erythromycin esterase
MRSKGVGLVVAVLLLLAPLAAQTGNSTWVSWARANHHPIAAVQSFEGDTFEDLQFFKTVLGNRRIVQLGESGHGVAEFNHAKVRLIKFLHEQMGFDVMAFESGIYECFSADQTAAANPALVTMRNCIFGVWHTNEVVPLFDYIKSTHATARPLRIAGFDTQISSRSGSALRPNFFRDVMAVVDAVRAEQARLRDSTFIQEYYGLGAQTAKTNEAALTEFYGGLELFFQEHRERLKAHFGDDPSPAVAERAAWSMLRFWEQLRAGIDRPTDSSAESGGGIRDFGMANNLTFLANELYPGRKIMVWAHNFHIRHDNTATTSRQPTMGQWVRERFRDELYTIGLYMDRGTAAQNNRTIYSINSAPANSMEWIMNSTGSPTLFMDFLHQQRADGNSWMFQSTTQREWGVNAFGMVPRNQYDGVLFIDLVKSPAYVQ